MAVEHLTLVKASRSGSRSRLHMDAFILSREAMGCTPKTIEAYRYGLGGLVGFLDSQRITTPDEITPQHVRQFLVQLQRRGLRDTTVHLHARCMKTWLRWLVDEGMLHQSPMVRVAMPRLEQRIPAPYTPEEIQALLSKCERKSPKGLRASELLGLRVGDLDMRTGLAKVMGKGRKERQIRMGSKARSAILRYLATRFQAGPSEPLWIGYAQHGGAELGPLRLHGLQTMLVRLGRRANVHPCAPHRFRRTFALWCLRDGCDLHSLRLMMGHSDLTVLQRYLALAGEDIERAHAAHSPADRML